MCEVLRQAISIFALLRTRFITHLRDGTLLQFLCNAALRGWMNFKDILGALLCLEDSVSKSSVLYGSMGHHNHAFLNTHTSRLMIDP